MNKFFVLIVSLLSSLSFQSKAQLTAEAGADTVVCNPLSYPRLGGAPTAVAGTPPYTYNWEYLADPPNTFFYLDIVTSANPKVRGVPLTGDTMTFRVTVTDNTGNFTYDIVRVYVTRWNCTGGPCVKNITEGDTISLGTGCSGNFSPHTILWTPNTNLSSTTSSNPKTWTKASVSYYAKTTNAFGCWRNDTCKVNVTKLSVEEIEKASGQVGLFPNPVNESSVFVVSNNMIGGVLNVYTIDGKLLLQQPIEKSKTPIGERLPAVNGVYYFMYEKPGMNVQYGKWVRE